MDGLRGDEECCTNRNEHIDLLSIRTPDPLAAAQMQRKRTMFLFKVELDYDSAHAYTGHWEVWNLHPCSEQNITCVDEIVQGTTNTQQVLVLAVDSATQKFALETRQLLSLGQVMRTCTQGLPHG